MRDGFREISEGWMLIDDCDDLTDRIERLAKWEMANGPLLPDEKAIIKMMHDSRVQIILDYFQRLLRKRRH
jgi:hypothetical protein